MKFTQLRKTGQKRLMPNSFILTKLIKEATLQPGNNRNCLVPKFVQLSNHFVNLKIIKTAPVRRGLGKKDVTEKCFGPEIFFGHRSHDNSCRKYGDDGFCECRIHPYKPGRGDKV